MTKEQVAALIREIGPTGFKAGPHEYRGFTDQKLERLIKLVRNAALEEAAIAAWNHYMDTCNKNKIAPASQERWLASQPIRNLKEPTP